ncbi:MAG: hypothetical protein EOL87_03340 [Spartobacteria bacterium]|nr:hypothetical protein [Spartobacteria bacterium]
MKNKIAMILACGVMTAAGAKVEASTFDDMVASWDSEATVGLDLASAYISDSSTWNNGFVLQPYLDVTGMPVEFGVWANYDIDDYDGAIKGNNFSEVDLTMSYPFAMGPLDSALSYKAWTYPSSSSEADQLVELNLSTGFMDAITVGAVGRYFFAGGSDKQWYVRPYASYDMSLSEDLSASFSTEASYINRPDDGEDGMLGYDFGVSLAYKYVYASVTYFGRFDEDVLPDGAFAYDEKVLFSVGTSVTF